jgi:hypothetical protein
VGHASPSTGGIQHHFPSKIYPEIELFVDVNLIKAKCFFSIGQVHIPANALVGLWRVNIETTTTTPGARVDEFRFKDDIYILFNPFCRGEFIKIQIRLFKMFVFKFYMKSFNR